MVLIYMFENIFRSTVYLSLVSFFMNFGNSMIYINTPYLVEKWKIDISSYVFLTLYGEFFGYIAKFLAGLLSDISSKKTLLLIGYGVSVFISKPLSIIASMGLWPIHSFAMGSFADKITNQLRDIPRDVCIIHSSQEHASKNMFFRRALGFLGSFLGGVLSIICCFFGMSITTLFLIGFAVSFIGFLLLVFKVKDVKVTLPSMSFDLSSLKNNLSSYIVLMIACLFIFIGKFNHSHLFKKVSLLGGKAIKQQFIFLIFHFGGFISSLFFTSINKSYFNSIVVAIASCIFANFLVYQTSSINFVMALSLFFGMFNGVIENLMVSTAIEYSSFQRKGILIGAINLVIGFSALIQSVLMKRFMGNRMFIVSIVALICSIIIFLILEIFVRKNDLSKIQK